MGEGASRSTSDNGEAGRASGSEERRRVVQGVGIAAGVGIALVGASLMAIAAVDLVTGGDGQTAPASNVGLIGLFGAMVWWGLQIAWPDLAPRPLARRLLARRASRQRVVVAEAPRPAVSEADERERRVLRLAERERGRLTVLEVAGRSDMTAEAAKALLDDLVLRKIAQLHVSEAGVLVYVFPDLLSRSERAARRRQRQG